LLQNKTNTNMCQERKSVYELREELQNNLLWANKLTLANLT
jgi:hypothetical protein